MLARDRPYRSPTNNYSHQDLDFYMSPPQLLPRRMGSESVNSRTQIIPRNLPKSLLLPMNLEEPTKHNIPFARFTLQPRSEASSPQTRAGEETTANKKTQTPVMVTPRSQNLNRRKRQREDESDDEEDEEELCRINLPKKLLLSLDWY